jgi:hypothetical protein
MAKARLREGQYNIAESKMRKRKGGFRFTILYTNTGLVITACSSLTITIMKTRLGLQRLSQACLSLFFIFSPVLNLD